MNRNIASLALMGVTFSLCVVACDEAKTETTAPPPRFEAVTKKSAVSEKDLDGFCDLRAKPAVKLPAISGGTEPKGARWINLWATWCKSCVEEMPMIEKWKEEHELSVLYVSTDESAEILQAFLKKHPEIPITATMNDPEALTDWMKEIGLDEGAGLPLHLFIQSDGSLACARAAAVSEHHLALIKSLLK